MASGMIATMCNLIFLAGLGCLVVGAFAINRAAGFIVLGLTLMAIGALAYSNVKQSQHETTHAP